MIYTYLVGFLFTFCLASMLTAFKWGDDPKDGVLNFVTCWVFSMFWFITLPVLSLYLFWRSLAFMSRQLKKVKSRQI